MTTGLSCLVDPRAWDQLLLDSEASLRLVDTALNDLFNDPGAATFTVEEFVPLNLAAGSFPSKGDVANGARPVPYLSMDGFPRSSGDRPRLRSRGAVQ